MIILIRSSLNFFILLTLSDFKLSLRRFLGASPPSFHLASVDLTPFSAAGSCLAIADFLLTPSMHAKQKYFEFNSAVNNLHIVLEKLSFERALLLDEE